MKIVLRIFIISLIFIAVSCVNGSELDYDQIVERELDKGVREDSLFLGYELGMESEQFFEYSWELNQQKVITGQTTVEYKLDQLKSPATLKFYPQFNNNKIYKMPIDVSYEGWAPWNTDLYADSLIIDLIEMYEDEYGGNSFFNTYHPDYNKDSWIKIDGNRRISIYKIDDTIVRVEFLDLLNNK